MSIKRVGFIVAAVLVLGSGVAYADHNGDTSADDLLFKLTGSGQCQTDGSYLITWKIDNTGNPAMAYDKGSVAADSSTTYTQSVDGTKTGPTTAEVTAHWDGTDAEDDDTETASTTLSAPCMQPQPVTNVSPSIGVESIPSPFSPPVPGFSGK